MCRSLRLLYYTVMDYPSSTANAVQQIKTAHAMARLGTRVIFFIKDSGGIKPDTEKILDYYGLNRNPNFLLQTITTTNSRHKYRIYLTKLIIKWSWSIKKYQPEAILTREPRLIVILYLFAKIAGVKLVFEAHDLANFKSWGFKRFHHNLQLLALKLADAIITVTDFCKQDMIKLGIQPLKILVAPDAADHWSYRDPRSQLTSDEIVNLTYIGSMHPERGTDILIRALPYMKSSFKAILVGGTKEQIDMMLDIANNLGVAERIRFIGAVPHRDVKRWIDEADILIMPTIDSQFGVRYTSPMKLFEYMASRRPIITSDLPTIRQILDEKSANFFIASDPQDLARAVIDTTENWAESLIKANMAYLMFEKYYTFDIRAAKILDFIQDILKK